MRIIILLFTFLFISPIYSQTVQQDSIAVQVIPGVVVQAYGHKKKLLDVPAALNIVDSTVLDRFNNINIISAVNSLPGVRMEERSPGSYRLNIRGSSQRSPFGVRNVKVYYNGIPFTDPAGHTYLNQLGFYNLQSVEIIKGPASSLYGAGMGGVMLIQSVPPVYERARIDYSTGSYGHQHLHGLVQLPGPKMGVSLRYQHQSSDGYRHHSALQRNSVSTDAVINTSRNNRLQFHLLFSDLFYQTPGALTQQEYNIDPKQARPAVGSLPSASESNAAIFLKSLFVGTSYLHHISTRWQASASLYGMNTELRNPTFRNYGRNSEPHFGGRVAINYQQLDSPSLFTLSLGTEVQQGNTSARSYANSAGLPGTLQTHDDIRNNQLVIFSQATYEVDSWVFTAGLSLNRLHTQVYRYHPSPLSKQRRTYESQFTPRFAVLRKLSKKTSLYSSISKGFSPPTTGELIPSGSIINSQLNPEQGYNYDLGLRGTIFSNRFYYDINTFYFTLQNTIVQRRDSTGGDYFINAGATKQFGVESYFSYLVPSGGLFSLTTIWCSHTLSNFKFKDFKSLSSDYSNNQMPGVPLHTIASGVEARLRSKTSININYYYSDNIPLNDANTAFASSYNILNIKIAHPLLFSKWHVKMFVAADNLLNVKYSLGNDINGFGGRYFNAAPTSNYNVGVAILYK